MIRFLTHLLRKPSARIEYCHWWGSSPQCETIKLWRGESYRCHNGAFVDVTVSAGGRVGLWVQDHAQNGGWTVIKGRTMYYDDYLNSWGVKVMAL